MSRFLDAIIFWLCCLIIATLLLFGIGGCAGIGGSQRVISEIGGAVGQEGLVNANINSGFGIAAFLVYLVSMLAMLLYLRMLTKVFKDVIKLLVDLLLLDEQGDQKREANCQQTNLHE